MARLRGSAVLWECLERLADLGLPDCYLGAGSIAQTVWSNAHDKAPAADISDYDVVYFDAADLTEHSENQATATVRTLMADLPLKVDVKNQARVHLWYRQRFGYEIVPYTSVEDAIAQPGRRRQPPSRTAGTPLSARLRTLRSRRSPGTRGAGEPDSDHSRDLPAQGSPVDPPLAQSDGAPLGSGPR